MGGLAVFWYGCSVVWLAVVCLEYGCTLVWFAYGYTITEELETLVEVRGKISHTHPARSRDTHTYTTVYEIRFDSK